MICPSCDMHHDGEGELCYECLMDWVHVLESGKPQIMAAITEWLASELINRDHRPENIECPHCEAEFTI